MRHQRLVNLKGQEYRDFLLSQTFLDCYRSTRARKRGVLDEVLSNANSYLALEEAAESAWTATQRGCAERRVLLIERLRHTKVPLRIDGEPSRRLVTLRALGHDPERLTPITEAEVLAHLRFPHESWWCLDCVQRVTDMALDETAMKYRCSCGSDLNIGFLRRSAIRDTHRWLDATPGVTPHYLGVLREDEEARCGLTYKELQKNKVALTDTERDTVMRRKATWNHGPNGEKTPAVWKSVGTRKTWYITNTHRAMACAQTLDGAIKKYHDFIKDTA